MVIVRLAGFVSLALNAGALEIQTSHVALEQNSTQQARINEAIVPSLAPKSDKKFFGKDYPDDLRPTIDKAPKWSYPYPKVQSDATYDVDYVKDENNDGGHWKAQMDYDEIKMKYTKQQAIVRQAALNEGMEKDEAMKVAKIKDEVWLKKNNAEAEAAKASEEEAHATAELDAAGKEEKQKEWEAAQKEGKSKEVFNAEQKVERAELHLKDCEKAVEDAKAELVNVLTADAARMKADHETKEGRIKSASDAANSKSEASKAKKAALEGKKASATAAEKEAIIAQKNAEKEEADDEAAIRSLKQEQDKLARLGNELKEAENRLRKFRGEPPLSDFHAETHSGAKQLSFGFTLVAATLALVIV